jgi:nucleotide-binding universal stress UspA family protein
MPREEQPACQARDLRAAQTMRGRLLALHSSMRTPRTILVPVDFGDASNAALDFAVDLVEGTDAKIYVLHTFEIPFVGLPDGVVAATAEVTSRLVNAAQRALDDTIARYKDRKVRLKALLKQGDAREVILAQVKEHDADLVCIGTHGRRGIARALIGSVAESVVRTCPVPVLTTHGPPET